MKPPFFTYQNRQPRHKIYPLAGRSLEQLENRQLMAADITALSASATPDLPDTATMEVDKLTKADLEKDGMTGKTGRRVYPLGTHQALNFKSYKFAKLPTHSLHLELGESLSELHKEEAFAQLDKLLANIEKSTASYHDRAGQWAAKYMAFSAQLGPEMAKRTAIEVLKGFGEKFVSKNSGVFAFKTSKADSFTKAYTHKGNTVAISNLKLWHSPNMEAKLASAGIESDIETYVYTAQFGKGPSHVGTAIAQTHRSGKEIAFLPMAVVKVDGLSTIDAASFLAHQLDDKGGFTNFVRNQHGEQQPLGQIQEHPIRRAARWDCNYIALATCSAEILETLEAELEEAKRTHEQAVNKLMSQYRESATEGLMEWTIGGAISGGLVGGWMGALAGGIGGAVAALAGIANRADELQESLDAADADYANAICQAKGRAINALVECISEHCPDAAEAAEQWANQQIEIEGCVWN